MKRYQLAKLVQLATKLETRKRLQKVVFLLQSAGWVVEADYRLHYFGPYSDDVAHLTDEMVQAKLLCEEEKSFQQGSTYNYELSPLAKDRLPVHERSDDGKIALQEFGRFEGLAKSLLGKDVPTLEHAATLVYFLKRAGQSWQEAIENTCRMKKLRKNSIAMRKAEELAKELLPDFREEG